jgi:hypothetical protein
MKLIGIGVLGTIQLKEIRFSGIGLENGPGL